MDGKVSVVLRKGKVVDLTPLAILKVSEVVGGRSRIVILRKAPGPRSNDGPCTY